MGSKLRNPLGPWTIDYDTHRFWHWQLTPIQCLLYQPQPNANTQVALLVKSTRQHLTFSATIPTNQAFDGHPVTPTDSLCCTIPLPVIPVHPKIDELAPWLLFTSLVDQF